MLMIVPSRRRPAGAARSRATESTQGSHQIAGTLAVCLTFDITDRLADAFNFFEVAAGTDEQDGLRRSDTQRS